MGDLPSKQGQREWSRSAEAKLFKQERIEEYDGLKDAIVDNVFSGNEREQAIGRAQQLLLDIYSLEEFGITDETKEEE